MDITNYQREANRTMNTNLNRNEKLSMLGLGLAGEAGEVVELLKKNIYHGHFNTKQELIKELGDVMWYIANLCTENNILLEMVLEENIEKLKKRYPNGFTQVDSIKRVDIS
jgi:NTP pyrophosphatase (non-canonical NTP hydrolase)